MSNQPVTPTKHKVTRPWEPAKLLDIPQHLKDPNFTYRFCNKNAIGNIQKKEAEGWEIDKDLSKKLQQLQRTINDGSKLDGTLQIREMIVMRMPKELAKARNEYYADKCEDAVRSSQRRFKSDVSQISGDYQNTGTYGQVEISKGGN